ncbi:MAG: anti-sigma regulatory factor [Candidatus Tectimicrobiota bacterium]
MSQSSQGEVTIRPESDIVSTRRAVREIATALGFGLTAVTRIVTVTSELARNIVLYAGTGLMRWRELWKAGNVGLELVLEDQGPGIPSIEQVMQEGDTTSRGLDLGLPGTKPGQGTRITVRKWHRR